MCYVRGWCVFQLDEPWQYGYFQKWLSKLNMKSTSPHFIVFSNIIIFHEFGCGNQCFNRFTWFFFFLNMFLVSFAFIFSSRAHPNVFFYLSKKLFENMSILWEKNFSEVKAHYEWANFHQKRWCISSIIVCSKFKFWWHHLTILYISKKPLNVHNILEFKFHIKSKLITIQQLDEKDWIKSMYTTYIMCSFSLTIGLHVCGS